MINPTSREEWEGATLEQLKEFSDLQLKKALQDHFGLKSLVYFMPVGKKREYILDADERPTIQAAAQAKKDSHQKAGASHKGKAPVKELIAERSAGNQYEFVGVDRPEGGFVDSFTDRRGAVAYVIADLADGFEFPTQKRTCKALAELGRLVGFDERISAKKQKPAHKAGFTTIEDVIASGDPEVAVAASAIVPATELPEVDDAPLPADKGTALDDILNSFS